MPALEDTIAQIRAAQAGDRASLDALFARYWPLVRRIVALRLGTRGCDADFDDLAQEALLKAFRAFDRFATEQSEGTFRNWLARIVENAVRDHGRRQGAAKRRSASPLTETEPLSLGPRPSQVAAGHELEQRIEAALLDMSERNRELIVLRDRCEMDYGDIAVQLGLKNADTARALHHRALRALAAALEKGVG